ncbi:MAG: Dabb family protein [Prolixibacteraceae bacterium]|nr:Dabb family protein [Prolixibacteraceae bacterium]
MINHIVLFKLKPFSADEKVEILNELKFKIEELNNVISKLVSLEVGLNHESFPGNYDLALIARFDSFENLDAYQSHPAHQKVLTRIKEVIEAREAVDFEY